MIKSSKATRDIPMSRDIDAEESVLSLSDNEPRGVTPTNQLMELMQLYSELLE